MTTKTETMTDKNQEMDEKTWDELEQSQKIQMLRFAVQEFIATCLSVATFVSRPQSSLLRGHAKQRSETMRTLTGRSDRELKQWITNLIHLHRDCIADEGLELTTDQVWRCYMASSDDEHSNMHDAFMLCGYDLS